MWNPSMTPVELFLNNRLDKDIEKIVQPFNIMLSIFFSSKYKIRDSYITPCEKKYPVLLFFFVLFFNVLSAYRLFTNNSGDMNNAMGFIMFLLSMTFYYVGSILLIICNIVHSRNNISLIMSIQEIYRSIDISARNYIIWNWISVLSTIGFFISTTTFFYVIIKSIQFVDISRDLVNIAFDLNLVYNIRIVALLTIYLKEWVKNISIIIHVEEENDMHCEQSFKMYLNILKAFSLYKTCFRVLVLWTTIYSLFRSLSFVEGHLIYLQVTAPNNESEFISSLISVIIVVWIIKDMTLIIITSMQCEKFYVSVEEAGAACIQAVMDTNCPKNVKHLCKRVLQVNRSFSKMTACGLFTIDATLPIPLMGLMTKYIIVLLQFAFL